LVPKANGGNYGGGQDRPFFKSLVVKTLLSSLAEKLTTPVHLVLGAEYSDCVELVAIKEGDALQVAFPIPSDLHQSVIEIAQEQNCPVTWLDVSTAAHLGLEQMPADFWDNQMIKQDRLLTITFLGPAALKYLTIYRAVGKDDERAADLLRSLSPAAGDLAKIAKWLRDEKLFSHHHGEKIMKILSSVRDEGGMN